MGTTEPSKSLMVVNLLPNWRSSVSVLLFQHFPPKNSGPDFSRDFVLENLKIKIAGVNFNESTKCTTKCGLKPQRALKIGLKQAIVNAETLKNLPFKWIFHWLLAQTPRLCELSWLFFPFLVDTDERLAAMCRKFPKVWPNSTRLCFSWWFSFHPERTCLVRKLISYTYFQLGNFLPYSFNPW